MITDEEIKELVRSISDPDAVDPFCSQEDFATLNLAELKAIYQLGRQHQRESDAALCLKSDRYRGDYFAEKILANTE